VLIKKPCRKGILGAFCDTGVVGHRQSFTVGEGRPELVHIRPLIGPHASGGGGNQKNTVIESRVLQE